MAGEIPSCGRFVAIITSHSIIRETLTTHLGNPTAWTFQLPNGSFLGLTKFFHPDWKVQFKGFYGKFYSNLIPTFAGFKVCLFIF